MFCIIKYEYDMNFVTEQEETHVADVRRRVSAPGVLGSDVLG